jgi:hypothetical protein
MLFNIVVPIIKLLTSNLWAWLIGGITVNFIPFYFLLVFMTQPIILEAGFRAKFQTQVEARDFQ